MMTQWHEFLAAQGAVIDNNMVTSFGNSQAELQTAAGGHILADLSHLGLLQVAGDDAVTFLQGQLTNDVKQLDGSTSHYAGYCNPKGRLLALFLSFAHQDHIHLQLDGALVEPILKRLKMYVMRSKVVITDVTQDIVRIGVAGANSESLLKQLFDTVPQQPHQISTLEHTTLIRLPGPLARFEVLTNSEYAAGLWEQLNAHFTPVGKNSWDYLEIHAGIPEIVPGTQEAFVPQMVNLDALGGINFKKGCYTGQEIVARTHYLGKVKRRTQLAHISTSEMAAPKAGDAIHAKGTQDAVGQIVRSAAAVEGGFDVLAEVRLDSLEAGTVDRQGNSLVILSLPYSLASE
ncbi:MAG: CAF17-like 4Fe-4S cluster assembly/insertion protein YgfZ [Methylophilaceae bacterium]